MSARYRNYVFTFNNYPDTVLVDTIDCRYIGYSKEVAPTTGTPHLQGWISFTNNKTVSAVRALLPGCHVSVMNGTPAQNEAYCSKASTMVHRGDVPMINENKGRADKLRYQAAWDLGKKGLIEEIDPDIRLRFLKTLETLRAKYGGKPPAADNVYCFWIHGPTETGKSHVVETTFPDCYKKPMDDMKWFDLYDDEDTIYLEDIDVYQVKWGGMLKRLADKWPMMASVKGSMRYIRPKRVIVTSNYTIREIWGNDPKTYEPLERRFVQILKTEKHDLTKYILLGEKPVEETLA